MSARTIADFFRQPAGTRCDLGDGIVVSIGEVTTIDLHPSGTRFDGPAIIVSAYISNGNKIARAISLADPTFREVVKTL